MSRLVVARKGSGGSGTESGEQHQLRTSSKITTIIVVPLSSTACTVNYLLVTVVSHCCVDI